MTTRCSSRRRATPAPASRADAIEALAIAASEDETLVIGLLDRDRRPLAMLVVDHCPCTPDDIVLATDVVLEATARTAVDALVIASRAAPLRADVELDLWRTLTSRCTASGVRLLDWLVIDDDGACSVPALWDELAEWFSPPTRSP
ncbi:MAG: hypothetical protein ACYDH6_13735 [Acidimicrobiales bacterium]